MKRKPPFTPEETRKLLREFIDHFGNLSELITIRHVLQGIEAKLGDITDAIRKIE